MTSLSLEQSEGLRYAIRWAESPERELTITAPAGSGKSRLAQAIAQEIGARVITFTRRAGRSLMQRGCPMAGTLYSLAARNAPQDLVARWVTEDVRDECAHIWCEHRGFQPRRKGAARELFDQHGPQLFDNVDMLEYLPCEDRVWIVDEAQDLTAQEVEAIRAATGKIIWIGDPMQQIYGWRGAQGIPVAPSQYGLSVNFRSVDSVVEAAARISGRQERGTGKQAEPATSVAWLCRSNYTAQAVAEARGLHLVAKPDRRRVAILTIQAQAELGHTWARALRPAPSWEKAWERWGRGMEGRHSPLAFLVWANTCDLQDFLEPGAEMVMTVHAAKGLEFGEVRVVDWKPGKDENEDRCLRYVAQTRGINRSDWITPADAIGEEVPE